MRGGLRPSGSRFRDACCLESLASPQGGHAPMSSVWARRCRVLCGCPFSKFSSQGAREKIAMWAGAGVEECQCSCGTTRRIGATNRGAACVALPLLVLPATFAGRPVPGSAHIVMCSPRPGATCHPKPRPQEAARARGLLRKRRFPRIRGSIRNPSELRLFWGPRVSQYLAGLSNGRRSHVTGRQGVSGLARHSPPKPSSRGAANTSRCGPERASRSADAQARQPGALARRIEGGLAWPNPARSSGHICKPSRPG